MSMLRGGAIHEVDHRSAISEPVQWLRSHLPVAGSNRQHGRKAVCILGSNLNLKTRYEYLRNHSFSLIQHPLSRSSRVRRMESRKLTREHDSSDEQRLAFCGGMQYTDASTIRLAKAENTEADFFWWFSRPQVTGFRHQNESSFRSKRDKTSFADSHIQ